MADLKESSPDHNAPDSKALQTIFLKSQIRAYDAGKYDGAHHYVRAAPGCNHRGLPDYS